MKNMDGGRNEHLKILYFLWTYVCLMCQAGAENQ